MKAFKVPIEYFKDLPYHPEAPIKKESTVYKINSNIGDVYKNGTKGVTKSAQKDSKGTFNYLVEFKVIHDIEGSEGIIMAVLCQIDAHYITEEKPKNI